MPSAPRETRRPRLSFVVTMTALQMPLTQLLQLAAGGDRDALDRVFEALDPELAQVVEMRYFAGYSEPEIAALLEVSERTVRRQWDKARAFLLASLRE